MTSSKFLLRMRSDAVYLEVLPLIVFGVFMLFRELVDQQFSLASVSFILRFVKRSKIESLKSAASYGRAFMRLVRAIVG